MTVEREAVLASIVIAMGSLVGSATQFIVLQNIANGKWEEMSRRRKRGQVLAGALGGVVAGLMYFANMPAPDWTAGLLFKALLWEFGGGFMGLGAFEGLETVRRLRRGNNGGT